MRISKKTQSITQNSINPSRQYASKSLVLRESIFSFSIRLFLAEFFLGFIGISLRIPLIYLLNQFTNPLTTYISYAAIYLLFQLINIFMLVVLILDWYNRTYIIRGKDIMIKQGVFSLQEKLIQYDNMEQINVYQSLLGRLLDFGSIRLYNPLLKTDTYLTNVPNPSKHAHTIQESVPKSSDQKIIVQQ